MLQYKIINTTIINSYQVVAIIQPTSLFLERNNLGNFLSSITISNRGLTKQIVYNSQGFNLVRKNLLQKLKDKGDITCLKATQFVPTPNVVKLRLRSA